jgi:hypothetical protein
VNLFGDPIISGNPHRFKNSADHYQEIKVLQIATGCRDANAGKPTSSKLLQVYPIALPFKILRRNLDNQ